MRAYVLTIGLVLLAPLIASAAGPQNLHDLVGQLISFINKSTSLLMILAIVVFFYGTTSNLFRTANGETRDMRNYLLWGVLTIFIMFSIWGILSLLESTIFGSSNTTGSAATATTGASPSVTTPTMYSQ